MTTLKFLPIVLLFIMSGCATPPEVKQLSIKQMEYFDSAISAVSRQSDALIMATEKLVGEAKARIDAEEQQAKSSLIALIQAGGLDQSQAETLADQITNLSVQSIASKRQLDADLAAIKEITREINAYLTKMKEIHIAMDSYVQSEKAGEAVIADVLNQPSVNTLLAQINDLTPRLQNGLSDLSTLLDGI